MNRGGGALHREPGITLPILARLAAFLQQTRARLGQVPTPVQRQQAEGEIGAADVRPIAVVRLRGILQTTLVTGPLFGSPASGNTAGRHCPPPSGAAATPNASNSPQVTMRRGVASRISTTGKSGAYRRLKLTLPARRVAPEALGSAPLPWRSRRAQSGPPSQTASHA
jgi:hypothetical protein